VLLFSAYGIAQSSTSIISSHAWVTILWWEIWWGLSHLLHSESISGSLEDGEWRYFYVGCYITREVLNKE
jgi:hypothetical protein